MDQSLSYAAWPVEEAWRYYVSSFILEASGEMRVSEVNAALSLEMLIKSFFMTEVSGYGTEYARYKPNAILCDMKPANRHHLHKLALELPEAIRKVIFKPFDLEMLEKRGDAFTSLRYSYEGNARIGSSSILREIAGDAIPRVVVIHKTKGSTDPWILGFDKIRENARKKHGTRL